MQRVNEFVFYELALKVHPITTISEEQYRYSANWMMLWNAREAVDQVYTQRSLHFTTPAAARLYQAITQILPTQFPDVVSSWQSKTADPIDVVPSYQVVEIREAAKEFETALRTECQLMDTYFVSKKGAYSTKDLVENAHHQIPEPGRSELPPQARFDFDQAGKCIAFDVPTAAAFHLLRGTEAVIREYYQAIVPGPKRASDKMRNWGVYIKLMTEHGGDSAALNVLDHMREVYRNPVTHPDENYTDQKVQVLFGLCVSAVTLLLGAITAAKAKGGNLNFPAVPLAIGPTP